MGVESIGCQLDKKWTILGVAVISNPTLCTNKQPCTVYIQCIIHIWCKGCYLIAYFIHFYGKSQTTSLLDTVHLCLLHSSLPWEVREGLDRSPEFCLSERDHTSRKRISHRTETRRFCAPATPPFSCQSAADGQRRRRHDGGGDTKRLVCHQLVPYTHSYWPDVSLLIKPWKQFFFAFSVV